MKTLKLILSMFICFNIFADIGSTSIALGGRYISYTETHQFQPVLDKKFTETVPRLEFDSHIFFIPFWAYMGINANYMNPVISSSTTDKATFLRYSAYAGLVIPTEPFKLKLESEYLIDTMSPNTATFGYNDLKGSKASVVADWVSDTGMTNIRVKVPIWSTVKDRSEYALNIFFYYGESKGEVPTLIKGFFTKLSYTHLGVEIPGTTTIEISENELGLDIGYNW